MAGVTFQRARSEEQRELRRRVILDTAAAMLAEMPVADLSLNELSRRVGLAKSNVLRYYESREAVLLELLISELGSWVSDLSDELLRADAKGRVTERTDRLAALLATSLIRRPTLCDLIAAQPNVLEHNASAEVVLNFKRISRDHLEVAARSVRRMLPELGDAAGEVCLIGAVLAGALWSHSQCSTSALEAYALDPSLAALRLDFPVALEQTLATLIAGTLARSRRRA
jgi:AcrR family transcriptional regulator